MRDRTSVKEIGIHQVVFSADNRYVALKDNARSSCLWIWDMKRDRLHTEIVFRIPIMAFAWHPSKPLIAVVTNSTIYFWDFDHIVWTPLTSRMD